MLSINVNDNNLIALAENEVEHAVVALECVRMCAVDWSGAKNRTQSTISILAFPFFIRIHKSMRNWFFDFTENDKRKLFPKIETKFQKRERAKREEWKL